MLKNRRKISRISALHYLKLVERSLLLVVAAVLYILGKLNDSGDIFGGYEKNTPVLAAIWLIFAIEMMLRFFPDKVESMGCQKQFSRNYKKREDTDGVPVIQPAKVTIGIAVGWLAMNAVFGILYYTKVIDGGILLLISLVYSVCDMICILFFCPFQTWFMKNKCCTTCRIYNWDYAMMFTPLVFIIHPFTISIFALSAALLIRWEISVKKHPERFSENTNNCLSCTECEEKLCHHKKQLKGFLKKNKERLYLKGNAIIGKVGTRIKDIKKSKNKE
ncbi:MAG: hypothetical protein E7623_01265 [Ruminococcaceae bacterium]|nr:hypothetical protein [Oscillospiraceae bacterium]